MKILVTGGSGVIGEAAVRELHRAGHSVRVLARHAGRDQKWWPAGVEGWAGDVSNERSIRGAAEGCDAVVHIVGIIEEEPPAVTFQSVNIEGTRYTVLEAERACVRKFVYVSSLGAERGRSEYHKSKLVGEDVTKTFSRDWVVLRPGAVYGPGDGHLSVLLRMVRTLPVIPTIGDGNQKFQPIWHEDFAKALRVAVERDDVRCGVFDVAGEELTSQNDLINRLRRITGRPAVQAPLPELITGWGLRALDAIGVDVPLSEAQLEMLTEGNVVPDGAENALTGMFGVSATPLDTGLRLLADAQPEQLPDDGVGPLTRRRFWVDVAPGRFDADGLFEHVRAHLPELLPAVVRVGAEPNSSIALREGETITLEIPVRGNIQVRVAEVADHTITLLTLAGHPIAGAVRFIVSPRDTPSGGLRFEIQVYERAANVFDELLMRTMGEWLQRATWVGLAENVAAAAGERTAAVESRTDELRGHDADVVNEWAATLAAQLSRKSTSGGRS